MIPVISCFVDLKTKNWGNHSTILKVIIKMFDESSETSTEFNESNILGSAWTCYEIFIILGKEGIVLNELVSSTADVGLCFPNIR